MGWGARKRMSTRKKRVEREGGSSGSTLLNAANSRPSQAPANLISFLLCFLCFSLFSRGRAGDRNKRYKTKGSVACVTPECRFCRSPWPRVRASHSDDSTRCCHLKVYLITMTLSLRFASAKFLSFCETKIML